MLKWTLPLLLVATLLHAQEFGVTPLDLHPSNAGRARIAASGTGYLVVFDTLGTRLDPDGNPVDAVPRRIATPADNEAVVGLHDDYIVALKSGGRATVIHVASDGNATVAGSIFGPPFDNEEIALATNGSNVLAVQGGSAALLDWNGNPIGDPIPLPRLRDAIAVASDGQGYLVAGRSSDLNLAVIAIDGRGQAGSPVILDAASRTTGIAVASDGSRFLVASVGTSLRTQVVGSDGVPFTATQVTTVPAGSMFVRTVWDGDHYAVGSGSSANVKSTLSRFTRDGDPVDGTAPLLPSSGWFDLAPANGGVLFVTSSPALVRYVVADAAIADPST